MGEERLRLRAGPDRETEDNRYDVDQAGARSLRQPLGDTAFLEQVAGVRPATDRAFPSWSAPAVRFDAAGWITFTNGRVADGSARP